MASGSEHTAANLQGVEPLVVAYQQTGEAGLLDAIVQRGTALVRHFAGRYASRGTREDLEQAGYEGLVKAARNYDPGRGVSFVTYAAYLVTGEMRHYLRGEVAARQPRWVAGLWARMERASTEFQARHGRSPDLAELSEILNVKEESLAYLLEARTVSFEEVDASRISHRYYESFRLPIEDRIVLAQALETLSELQKKVIDLLFYQGMTQREAGEELGLSQRKVSRLLQGSLAAVRKLLLPS